MPEFSTKLRPRTVLEDLQLPAQQAPPYAELDVVSNFSFLRGASHADELISRAAELGYRAIAITDLNTLSGVVRAWEAAKEASARGPAPRLIIGAHLTFEDAPDLLVYPTDRAAYARLCRLLTLGKRRATKGHCQLFLRDLLDQAQGLLAVITGDPLTLLPGLEDSRRLHHAPAASPLAALKEAFGDRLSLAVARLYGQDDDTRVARLAAIGRRFSIPLLATNHVHYHDASRRELQDILTCVRHGCTINEAGYRLFSNAERYLKAPWQMHRLFCDLPQAIHRGLDIAERAQFDLSELRYGYPAEVSPPGMTQMQYLRQLAWEGAAVSLDLSEQPSVSLTPKQEQLRRQLHHELRLIAQLRYEAYFLTVYDVVQFARSRAILCQGRGSAANSITCYCLGITAVDPSRIDVLFERFISAARGEPPDIDVDFEHERREEVLQYLYEKYGRERAGMTAEVITYRGRSAIRDVGKAMGLGEDQVDQMARRLDWWDRGTLTDDHLREMGMDPRNPLVRRVVNITAQLLGFPRHLSQHTGGMVMTQGPLCEMVPIENAAMENRTVIEWDKNDIDALGILKVDCLALGMLTCLSKSLRLINSGNEPRRHGGTETNSLMESMNTTTSAASTAVDMHGHPDTPGAPPRLRASVVTPLELRQIPPEDPSTYNMICRADTIGVFQIESRAQMSMLPRLRPRCFYDLVIEVAIVRPGPIQGNMVHPYLRRRNGEEQVSYPSEALRDVLGKTLGVPLFQEQAMKIAMVGAGFTAEEADQLRRAMAAWRRHGAIERFYGRFIEGMRKNGYTQQFADYCFEQIRGFGVYGFPESHSASFALLVYASAWIKCHYPAEFACALLNSQPMGFYAPAQIVRDAKEHGVRVLPPDINSSEWDCTIEEVATKRRSDEATKEAKEELELGSISREATKQSQPTYIVNNDEAEQTRIMASGHVTLTHAASLSPCPPPSPSSLRRSVAPSLCSPALRLGFRQIKTFPRKTADRLVSARGQSPFTSIADLHRRSGLKKARLVTLAEADAFQSLGLSRREALWQVMALSETETPLFDNDAAEAEEASNLPTMPLGQQVVTDYATVGLSLKSHPLALLRQQLNEQRILTAEEVMQLPAGRWVKVAGIVLIRQRPATASGIVFCTIEDETGILNLIIRQATYDHYREAARFSTLLQADGYVERQGDVLHVMTKRLFRLDPMLHALHAPSRDFH
jgi:error-prone DNA polymerase